MIISREGAISSGFNRFYTGEACQNGHLAERYVSSRVCLHCTRSLSSDERRAAYDKSVSKNPRAIWASSVTGMARTRANKYGLPFNLTTKQVLGLCVDLCPAIGVQLVYCSPKQAAYNSAQLDKIVPELGYVMGNVQVISRRANQIKSDATPQEVALVSRWLNGN